MNGLDLLAKLRTARQRPRVVVMTSDDAPETLLKAVREQAFKYVHKPVESPALLQTVRDALAAPSVPPIEVISARPDWVELVVPCTREAADRIEEVMAHLDADLAPDVRESIGYAFRELLLNAVEWGGKLDPSRKVRICLPAREADVAVPDCRSRSRLQPRGPAARGDRPGVRTIRSRTCRCARPRAFGRAASAC